MKNKYLEEMLWLYLDDDLDEKKTRMLEKEISANKTLQKKVQEFKQIASHYYEAGETDIMDGKFDQMIRQATAQNNSYSIKHLKLSFSHNIFYKTAAAGVLVITAILFLLLHNSSQNSEPNLDWEVSSLNERIENIYEEANSIENLIYSGDNFLYFEKVREIESKIRSIENDLINRTEKKR